MRSDLMKKGPERAPHRALLKAMGYTDAEIRRPLIGVVNAASDVVPGHVHLDVLAADVKAGCCGSVTDLFAQPFNHHPVIEKGLRADEAQQLLQEFFVSLRARRAAKPRWKPPVNP